MGWTVFILALGIGAGGPSTVEGLLEQRHDVPSSESVVDRLEDEVAAGSGPSWTEALLRARKFLADGLEDPERADRLHRRNVREGLAALSHAIGRSLGDFDDLVDALERLPPEAVGLAYWTALSYGRTIPNRSVWARPSAARDLRRVLAHLVRVDPSYFWGGPLRALAMYDASAPGLMGGDRKRAIQHALEAMRMAPGFAPNRVVLAQVTLEVDPADPRVVGLLEGALEPPDGRVPPDAEPEHRRAQDEASELLDGLK